jgi:hypothetical protein
MSFQAMTWAVNQKTKSSGEKLVLLMLANYCNSQTGQCNPSHKRLSYECSMGISTLKRHLSSLEKDNFLTVIHKFQDGVQLPNQYQLNLNDEVGSNLEGSAQIGLGVGSNQAEGQPKSGWGVSPNRATNQEFKPIIKPVIEPYINFETFWKRYPKKVGKDKALEVWKKKKPSIDDVMFALSWQIESKQWQSESGKYIPNPATYLNQGRWQDEAPAIEEPF